MITELPRLRPVCECRLGHRCAACEAYHRENKPLGWSPARTVAQARDSTQHLAAAHDDIVRRIAAGEPYSSIACVYQVTIEVFLHYLKRTGAYIPRQIAQRERLRTLAPSILADYAAGMLLKDLAQKHNISMHAIRCMKQRVAKVQRTIKDT